MTNNKHYIEKLYCEQCEWYMPVGKDLIEGCHNYRQCKPIFDSFRERYKNDLNFNDVIDDKLGDD